MSNEITDKDTMNDYINYDGKNTIQNEYFSKITPDISVLDMVEKYIVDGNDITNKPLIYYVKGRTTINNDEPLDTGFYRLFFKTNLSLNRMKFNCPFESYINSFSLISTTDETIKITFDTSGIDYEIIGVGF